MKTKTMKHKVIISLILIALMSANPLRVWRVPAQTATDAGQRILADDTLFSRESIGMLDMNSFRADAEKVGYVLPEASRPSIAAIKARYGDPDLSLVEKAPRLEASINPEDYARLTQPPPISWVETEVCYYGDVGFGISHDGGGDSVLFVTNRAEHRPDANSGGEVYAQSELAPAANNYDGNWDEGASSSSLFFTVVDNAITNATITNLRFTFCSDGGVITTSYAPPVQITGNTVEFTVSGFTGRNVWSITQTATFSSDTSVSGSQSYVAIGNCGFIFGFTSFSATKQPDYVLFTRPSLRNILSGESTSYTVGVNALGTFNRAVDVEMLVPQQAGVTLSLSSSRIQPGGTATLEVTTAANAPSVLLGIIFRSSTGQATHNTIAILDLRTFEISISPATQTIGKGQSASFTLTTRTAQFRERVNLSSSVSPSSSSISVNLASSSLLPGESTSFTASSTPAAASNTYSITITARAGSISEAATARLRVSDPDFEFAVISPQQVGPGGSSNVRVDVLPIVGYNQPVNLSVSVSPDNGNLSASISPSTVSPGGSATLTLRASQNAQANSSFTVTVRGTSGSLNHSTNFTARVSGPDFTLAFDPPSITSERGRTVKSTLNINRVGGFNGNVTVTAPDTGDIKVKVKPGETSTTDSSISFKFKIKGSGPTGTQRLVFTGKDDSGRQRTATLTLVLQ